MNNGFEDAALGRNADEHLLGCEGDDFGSPEAPSIWLFGIEPGFSKFDQSAENAGCSDPRYTVEFQLRMNWPFNRNAFKLLASIAGEAVGNYEKFAHAREPFVKNKKGYFKGNLFPIACNKEDCWNGDAAELTGFEYKEDMQNWCREKRFPEISRLIRQHRPKVFIGSSLGAANDFLSVTEADRSTIETRFTSSTIGGTCRYLLADGKFTKVVVIPHLSGAFPSDLGIQELGKNIADWIER